ncbi:MAG: exo-alpha-sialidase [Bacteroidales bacterium]|nr:exo-alpha-sialidase [Bacteroidales bacterium]
MKQLLIIIYVALSFFMPLSAQEDKVSEYKEYFDEGEFFFNRGDYQEALYYYLRLVDYQPENSHYNFKIGESYLNIPGQEAKAIPYFEKAVKNITEKNKYKKRSFEETNAPLHAYFYLGNAYRIDNQLDKALEAYNTFVLSPFYAGNYNVTIVENEIKSCERAKIIEDNPLKLEETLLAEVINTSASELYPVLSGSENKMVFVRRLKFYDALYYSKRDGETWSDPVNITPDIGSDGEFYPASLSNSGNELYLIRKTDQGSDIYVSYFENEKWTKAEKLAGKINSTADETGAGISENGQLLYIASNRKGGSGGYDIYVSKRIKDNTWGKPKNLGKTINTPFDEASPVVLKNGAALFFSSKGHYNMGGYDIFYAIADGKKWNTPVNLGSPVNNTGDNIFYYPVGNGNTGYLSKFPADEGNENIFRLIINSNLPEF